MDSHVEKAIQSDAYRSMIAFLRKSRRDQEMSQEELARRLGVAQNIVSAIESGQRRVDVMELAQLCDALGLDFLKVISQFWDAYRVATTGP